MTILKPDWQLVTDRVMGGQSSGKAEQTIVDGKKAIRMTGRVSLENNGGFVQMAADFPVPPSDAKGIAMMLIGNGEEYNIHLRTTELMRPWQSYRQTFTAPSEWTKCHFEFSSFSAYRTDKPLNLSRIRRIGIVAIGRVFDADVAVGEVSYY